MSFRQLFDSAFSGRSASKRAAPLQEYASFQEALNDSDSYEDARLIEIVAEKSKIYRNQLRGLATRTVNTRQLTQNLFVLSYVFSGNPITVLEVGGSCGASYFEMKQSLPDKIGKWAIVETPAMASIAQTIKDTEDLTFHSDLGSAVEALGSRELAIAQGVLQFAPDPIRMLRETFELGFCYVYISRTSVLSSPDETKPIFTKQHTFLSNHGPGPLPATMTDGPTTQPLTVIPARSLLSAIPVTYKLEFLFEGPEHSALNVGGRQLPISEIGFLAKRIEL
jgi:putative methyltransferase (TIGR04325 family)